MIQPRSANPLEFRYRAVAEALKHQVLQGIYKPGQQLPRQHDLAAAHNVAFATLKKALDILERDGYVVRRVGRGTYASLPETDAPSALVVDNDDAILALFADVLNTRGWNCVTASSGLEALTHLPRRRFDLVFLDLLMPVMDGAAAFKEIRKSDPDVPVVIITGHPDSNLMAKAMQTGPFAVMRKPFSLEEVTWMLNHSAQSRQPAAAQL